MANTIDIRVTPNARVSELVCLDDGTWVARLKAPPVDGRANAELIALLAKRFACGKARITITGGASSRRKRVRIDTD